MNTRTLLYKKRSASAMAMVLIAVTMLSILGAGLMTLGLHGRLFAVRNTHDISARNAADAGATRALYLMNKLLDAGSIPTYYSKEQIVVLQASDIVLPNDDATYSYWATRETNGEFIITAVGKSGSSMKRIACSLELKGPFDFAVFTDQYLDFKAGTLVDWYNNDPEDGTLQIGTNSNLPDSIVLGNGATINGDIILGAYGDPDSVIRDGGATVNGGLYVSQEQSLESVTVPQALAEAVSKGTLTTGETITTSGKYDALNLNINEIATIDGDVSLYVTGDILLGNASGIQIVDANTNPNASLTIYLGGSFIGDNGIGVNNLTKDASKLKVLGLDTCTSVRIKNSSVFYGAIYAPTAAVTFDNSAEGYGAVVADSFDQKNSSKFLYDASLRDVDESDELVRFVVKYWYEY